MASRRASSSAAPPSTHLPASSTAAAEEDSPRVLTSSAPNTQSRPPSTIPHHLRGESFQGRVSRRGTRGTASSPSPGSETNYPSWLPRRPPPPGPPSTFDSFDNGYPAHDRGRGALANLFGWRATPSHSRNLTSESGYVPSSSHHHPHRSSTDPAQPRADREEPEIEVEEAQGRRATPRSVRIISVPPEARSKEPSDQTRRQSSGGWGKYSQYSPGHVPAFSRSASNPYPSYMMPQSPSPLPAMSWPAAPLPTRAAPRFRASSLNLGLLRSTSRFARLRFHFSPFTYFAHVPVQLFLDFNAIYILTQITTYPTPLAPGILASTPSPTWSFALTTYALCMATWVLAVVVLYEVVWSFWRRWRVKRPGMMAIFSSRAARNLVGMGNFERWCFLHFVRRGAWTDMTDIAPGPEEEHEHEHNRERERVPTPSAMVGDPIPVEEEESMGGGTEGKKALRRERERLAAATAARREEHADVEAQLDIEQASLRWYQRLRRFNYRQGFVEWAWDRSQNIPTVVLLLPRAGIALAILLTYSTVNPTTLAFLNARLNLPGNALLQADANTNPASRDSTFFNETNGTLTTYAKTVLWVNCGWTLWKILILLLAYVTLWIASGQSCAGICGPRYRSEEEDRIEWEDATNVGLSEKYGHPRPHNTRRRPSLSGDSTVNGYEEHDAEGLSDLLGWRWRENTRRRIREAYDFCLSSPPVGRRKGDVHMRDLGDSAHRRSRGGTVDSRVAQVIKASSKAPERGRLSSALFVKPGEDENERDPPIQNVPPPISVPVAHEPVRLASQHATPITDLAFTFPPTAYVPDRTGSPSSDAAIPFPSPTPHSEDHQEEGEEYIEGEGEEVLSGRETASMSSLGQPINTRYAIGMGRPRGGRHSHSTGRTGTASDSPQEGGSKSTPSRSSRYSHQKSKSVSSHPSDPSSNQYAHQLTLAGPSNLPPPPSALSPRRRRKETPSEEQLSLSQSPQDLSPSNTETFGRQRPSMSSDPAPEPLYESDGDEEFVEGEVEVEVEVEESEGEEEDSVGLLGSKSPSPRGSFAAIRQRASSISESLHRRRTRSQGSQSQSNSNSSGNHRNRTRSLVQSPRGGASAGPSAVPSPSSPSSSQSRSRRGSLPPVSERFSAGHPSGSGQFRGLPGEQIFGQGIPGRYSDEAEREEVPEVPPLPRIRQSSGSRPEQPVASSSRVRSQSGTSAVPSERTVLALSAGNLRVRRDLGESNEPDPSVVATPDEAPATNSAAREGSSG